MKLFTSSLLAIFIGLLSFSACSNSEKKSIPSQETINTVKSDVANMNNQLPIEAGLGLVMTEVSYDETSYTINYKYQYTVPGVSKPSESQMKEGKKTAVNILKSTPQAVQLLENGISFHYDYYSIDDEYLYSTDISSEDISEK